MRPIVKEADKKADIALHQNFPEMAMKKNGHEKKTI
jgi:hypothetical protein